MSSSKSLFPSLYPLPWIPQANLFVILVGNWQKQTNWFIRHSLSSNNNRRRVNTPSGSVSRPFCYVGFYCWPLEPRLRETLAHEIWDAWGILRWSLSFPLNTLSLCSLQEGKGRHSSCDLTRKNTAAWFLSLSLVRKCWRLNKVIGIIFILYRPSEFYEMSTNLPRVFPNWWFIHFLKWLSKPFYILGHLQFSMFTLTIANKQKIPI